jgi:DNA-binding MarR family transcriptional regulator
MRGRPSCRSASRDNYPRLVLRRAEIQRAAAFRFALRSFLARTEAVAQAAELTPQRYDLLLAIKAGEDESATVTELSEQLALNQTAVSELVRRAEEAGLVRREVSSEDGRVFYLRLSEEGEARLTEAFSGLRADRAQLVRTFDELEGRFRDSTARSPARRRKA